MDHKKDQEFEQTLAESELLLRGAARSASDDADLTLESILAEFGSREDGAEAAAEPEDVEPYVRSCGFFRAKARDIVLCARKLVAEYGGRVPDTMEALTSLPGVGRKTANLILGDIYGQPAYVCDTHCIRITGRLGLTDGSKDPLSVEKQLRAILPPEESNDFCHRLVLFGRDRCTARKANCDGCPLRKDCDYGKAQK